ncbi:MAG: hypothetical protein RL338_332 [Chloroflexota bacterium]|jgi:hypothetical protein
MGSVARSASLGRFIAAHGEILRSELLAEMPPTLAALNPHVELVNEVDRIAVILTWTAASGSGEKVALEAIEADQAAAMDAADFASDCDMGW